MPRGAAAVARACSSRRRCWPSRSPCSARRAARCSTRCARRSASSRPSRRSSRCPRRAGSSWPAPAARGSSRTTARSGGSATTPRRRGRRSAASSSPRASTSWPRSSPTAPCAGRSRGPASRFPRWGGTETDTRIAYLERRRLHVVAGDGTGDADLGLPPAARVAPAWQPAAEGRELLLAYADTSGPRPRRRARLGRRARSRPSPGRSRRGSPGRATAAACSPSRRGGCASTTSTAASSTRWRGGPGARRRGVRARGRDRVVLLRRAPGATLVERLDSGRVLYRAAGELSEVVPSPDGRRLLLAWPAADQWVFVRTAGGGVAGRGERRRPARRRVPHGRRLGYRAMTKHASCDERATRSSRASAPLRRTTQSVPCESDGVSTRPNPCCTL